MDLHILYIPVTRVQLAVDTMRDASRVAVVSSRYSTHPSISRLICRQGVRRASAQVWWSSASNEPPGCSRVRVEKCGSSMLRPLPDSNSTTT